jgi:tetratricopeptide (TPR) repeat protein
MFYAQAQRDYSQELIYLLAEGRYFEARDYRLQYADQLQGNNELFDLFYKIHMSFAFNQPDSGIVYLEKLLGNQNYARELKSDIAAYFQQLAWAYGEKQQYEQSIATLERYINFLKTNSFFQGLEFIKNGIRDAEKEISLYKKKSENPVRKIVRDSDACEIELKDEEYIRFEAQYNGQTIETLFDTGCYYFLAMEKDLADDIGVKYDSNQDSIQRVNGLPIKALEGIIDSIDIKGIKLYNIPVIVLWEKFRSTLLPSDLGADYRDYAERHVFKERQIVLGVPTMKMIGRFEFDWESNRLYIPQKQEPAGISPASNLMVLKNAPYLYMRINNTEFTGLFDTGGDVFLYLTFSYFFKARCEYIAPEPLRRPAVITMRTGTYDDIEYQRVKNPEICFDGRKINADDSDCEVYTMDMSWLKDQVLFDGMAGFQFVKNIGSKCMIDFDTMTVECKD